MLALISCYLLTTMPPDPRPLLLLAFLGCYALPASATIYSFANIPYPSQGPFSGTTSILNNGTVFGTYYPTFLANPVAYSYQSGHFTQYPTFPDGTPIETLIGNNSGELTGTYFENGGTPAPGFTEQNGIYTRIPFLNKYTFFVPAALNDKGDIVGEIFNGMAFQAAICHNGHYTVLSFRGLGLYPEGINDAGEVVGSVSDGRAFIYSNGSYRFFSYDGFLDTLFVGVNNLGQIVGLSFSNYSALSSFLLQPNGTYEALVGPPQFQGFTPGSINDKGQIVGDYPVDCNSSYCDLAGFVATPIETAPEPSSFWLLGCPCLLLIAIFGARHLTSVRAR